MNYEEMICPCFGITLDDVKMAIKNGAKTFEDVQSMTNLGEGCGMCVESAKAIVEELLKQ